MLTVLRAAAGSWVAKVLIALLVASFAVFGISASSFNIANNSLATVGDEKISSRDFQLAYLREVNSLSQRFGQQITTQQAQSFGIPGRVLNQLITEAALNGKTSDFGMGLSDEKLKEEILASPVFRNTSGEFDVLRYQAALRNGGLTESAFIEEQKDAVVRDQLLQALVAGAASSDSMQNLIGDYMSERRTIDYFTLTSAGIDRVPDPTDEQLTEYFDSAKAKFAKPEYRSARFFVLEAADIVKPSDVTDEDARRYYEDNLRRFEVTETRAIRRITYSDRAEAESAAEKAATGAAFEVLIADKGISAADADLGTLTKAAVIDKKLAETAFKLEVGEVSGIIDGDFGPAIAVVTAVEGGNTQPFEEVVAQLKTEIASDRGEGALQETYDKIEDARGGGATFDEVADTFSLFLQEIKEVARTGDLSDGGELALTTPNRNALIAAIFESDIGLENDILEVGRSGYLWHEVTDIKEARDVTLDEVRDDVIGDWLVVETNKAIEERAKKAVSELQSGVTFASIAESAQAEPKSVSNISRIGTADDLSRQAIVEAYAGPLNHAGIAPGTAEGTWQIVRVREITKGDVNTADTILQMDGLMRDDLFGSYISQVQTDAGIDINNGALTGAIEALNATGGRHGY